MGGGKKVCVWFLANCEVQLCSALAAISILGVVVVCPVMLDPAIDTLVTSFEEGMCQTVYSRYFTGLSNCTWTSCREGCTADIYSCWHIIVVYMKGAYVPTFGRANEESSAVEQYNTINNSSLITSASLTTSTDSGTSNKYILPPEIHDYSSYNLTFLRDLNSTLFTMMDKIHENLDLETLSGSAGVNISVMMKNLRIAALIPNIQGCVYPYELMCADFQNTYGKVGPSPSVFKCYKTTSNQTFVVLTVDKAGAVRNIFYSLIPLIFASGVFTYLFYRVGLIGRRSRRRGKGGDEESGCSEGGSPQKNGVGVNGLRNEVKPPVVKKKFRKKFLPRKDSSKRRRGKIFNKKNLLSIKTQFAVTKSPGSSRRTPSISMGVASVSDDGYNSNGYLNNQARNSIQLL